MTTITRCRVSIAAALVLGGACAGEIQPAPTSRPEAQVVFQAAYSRDGRFTVTEDGSGWLGAGITGTTGVDDPANLRAKVRRSLVETHRALFPGAEVPETLIRLNERYLAQYAPGLKQPLGGGSELTAAAPTEGAALRITWPSPAARFKRDFCGYRHDNQFSSYASECWYFTSLERFCYWVDFRQEGTDAFPAAYAKNDGTWAGYLWGQRVILGVQPGQWALAVLSRESQEVCFDYDGSWGDFGLTKAIGQFDN